MVKTPNYGREHERVLPQVLLSLARRPSLLPGIRTACRPSSHTALRASRIEASRASKGTGGGAKKAVGIAPLGVRHRPLPCSSYRQPSTVSLAHARGSSPQVQQPPPDRFWGRRSQCRSASGRCPARSETSPPRPPLRTALPQSLPSGANPRGSAESHWTTGSCRHQSCDASLPRWGCR